MRSEVMRIQHELQNQKDKIKENTEKIKVRFIESPLEAVNDMKFCQVNKTLPYLVSNVIELLDVDPEELGVEEDGGHVDLDSQRKGENLDLKKCYVLLLCNLR